jgi:hypothetical protein
VLVNARPQGFLHLKGKNQNSPYRSFLSVTVDIDLASCFPLFSFPNPFPAIPEFELHKRTADVA